MSKDMAPIDISPRGQRGITDEHIATALRDCSGKLSLAAQTLRMSTFTLRERVLSTPALTQAWQEAQQLTVDIAELQLEKQVAAGNTAAIGLKLKAQAKDRGYGDELTVNVRSVDLRGALRGVMSQLSDAALEELEQALTRAEKA
jgi:hypothetical protein